MPMATALRHCDLGSAGDPLQEGGCSGTTQNRSSGGAEQEGGILPVYCTLHCDIIKITVRFDSILQRYYHPPLQPAIPQENGPSCPCPHRH